LNEFLLVDSLDYLNKLLAVTYIIENTNNTLAFYSVFNDRVSVEDFDSNRKFGKWREMFGQRKKFKSYPAVKIGRLGVSNEYKGEGYGTSIIDYIKYLFINNNRTGCRFVTVDAYKQSLKFYEKNGFQYFGSKDKDEDARQMYFDLLGLED
jgi:GNAT superfamily N-acetyltransferase